MARTTNWFEDIGRAALLGTLFTVLAFQEFRPEGYETEKAALLVIFAAGLIGPQLLAVRSLLRHPVVIGVLLLVAVGVISTLFSISPGRSWWGAPSRGQGLLTLLTWALIFLQAALIGQRIERDFTAVLVVIAVPLSLYSVLIHLNLDVGRPGSTTGNPNYLASWLILTAIFIGQRLMRPSQIRPLLVVVLGIIMIALALTASRGALVALVIGGFTFLTLQLAIRRKHREVLFLIGLAIAASIAYVAIGSTLNARETDTGLSRLFQPYDAFRLEVWQGASSVLNQQDKAFLDINGQPDQFTALRRFIGYGPDTVALMQSRYGALTTFQRDNVYLNSFHNQFFDSLVMMGGLGLLAWLVIYGGAVFAILRTLGLLSVPSLPQWVLVQSLAALAGIAAVYVLIPGVTTTAIAPLGMGLGSVLGIITWVAFVSRKQQPDITSRSTLLIGLLSIVVAHWVDVQFGFMTLAAAPLWWCLLGLLVAHTSEQEDIPETAQNTDPDQRAWLASTFCAGAFLTVSFGSSINSQIIEHSIGSAEFPALLLTILGTGMTISLIISRRDVDFKVSYLVLILVGWAILFAVKQLTNTSGGQQLDAIMNGHTTTTPMLLLSLDVVIATALILLAWLRRFRLSIGVLVSVMLFTGGALHYAGNYQSMVLYSVGNTFAETNDTAYLQTANTLYDASSDYPYWNPRLYLDWTVNLLKQGEIEGAERQIDQLLTETRFYIHTRDWALFSRDYVQSAP